MFTLFMRIFQLEENLTQVFIIHSDFSLFLTAILAWVSYEYFENRILPLKVYFTLKKY